jgi:hypothetical protein
MPDNIIPKGVRLSGNGRWQVSYRMRTHLHGARKPTVVWVDAVRRFDNYDEAVQFYELKRNTMGARPSLYDREKRS